MSNQNNGEMYVKQLTNVCQNVCTFIKTITEENISKDEKLNSFITKINDLHHLYSSLKTQQEYINEQIKKLACLLDFTINQDDSATNILSQWIQSLSKKNDECTKKRKLYSSYSPLKLTLKDKIETIDESTTIKSKCTKFEKKNEIKSQNELKNVWKLQIKRDGNPSDLLKKSKQTKLVFGSPKKKTKIDVTTFNNSPPKTSVLNSTCIFSPEICILKNNVPTDICDTNLIDNTQMNNSNNISISHFNKIIKPNKNILSPEKTNILKPNKSNIFKDQSENYDLSEVTICSPLQNSIISKTKGKITSKIVLDSFDIIPGLNDKQNDLPNYKFKEDPIRKRSERKCLNGGDCEDCCKFYEVNNTNPIDAKNAMNHYSRHRSVKNQYYAPTPPGFWDPI